MPSEQYMIFRRKRDSMEGPTIEGSSRERGMEGVAAAVADAVDAIGNLSGAELGRQGESVMLWVEESMPGSVTIGLWETSAIYHVRKAVSDRY